MGEAPKLELQISVRDPTTGGYMALAPVPYKLGDLVEDDELGLRVRVARVLTDCTCPFPRLRCPEYCPHGCAVCRAAASESI